eukprot:5119805-Amphidinium_carterae.1
MKVPLHNEFVCLDKTLVRGAPHCIEEAARLHLPLNRSKCTVLVQGKSLERLCMARLAGTGFTVARTSIILGVGVAAGKRRLLGKRHARRVVFRKRLAKLGRCRALG